MTTLVRIIIALLISLFFSSCHMDMQFGDFGSGKKGNGNLITETRDVADDFDYISAQEGLAVYVTQANTFKIEVEADENLIEHIKTDIKKGRLKVHSDINLGRGTKKIYVSLPEVQKLSVSSGGRIETQNSITAEDIALAGSSGGQLVVNLSTSDLEIDASSGASLNIDGIADQVAIDVSSGGNINAKDLQTKNCNADASSGGNIRVQVSKKLIADASSGGSIFYTGDAEVTKNKSISGRVRQY